MHELSVVFHIAKEVEKVALANNVKHVKKVTLEIGEVSLIVSSYLMDCWKWNTTKHEVLNGCELEIEEIKAITYCENCGGEYETVKYGKICPYCGSPKTYLKCGNETIIKNILVADE